MTAPDHEQAERVLVMAELYERQHNAGNRAPETAKARKYFIDLANQNDSLAQQLAEAQTEAADFHAGQTAALAQLAERERALLAIYDLNVGHVGSYGGYVAEVRRLAATHSDSEERGK